MILSVSEYVTDKLIKNCIAFGFFMAGVLLGIALILIIYQIFVHLKAKNPTLCTEYKEIDPENDPVIIKAKEKIYSLDTKISIEKFLFSSTQITVDAIRDIAKEYTGGKKSISLTWTLNNSSTDLDLTFDTDFSVEDFLIFIENTTDVIEDTILSVTDKYSILVNSFLKFIGLGKSVREITVKDIILYLNEKAQKKEQKLLKAVEKKEKQDEKARLKEDKKKKSLEDKKKAKKDNEGKKANKFLELFKPKQNTKKSSNKGTKNKVKPVKKVNNNKIEKKDNKTEKEEKENKLANIFKIKRKEKSEVEDVALGDNTKISAFYKPLNKVIIEAVEILLVGLCVEARKLYGRGYTTSEVEDVVKTAEALLCEPHSSEGGNE